MVPAAHPNLCVSLLIGLAVLAVLVLLFVGPIPQDPDYHVFADRRAFLGLPNALNVLSNLAFTVVGGLGLVWIGRRGRDAFLTSAERRAAYVFFAAVALVGIGSGWYHLHPSNESLMWDRLPLAVITVSILALLIAERLSERWGGRLLLPLVVLGLASVLYWYATEQQGAGDLRLYALAQYYPGAAMLVLLMFTTSSYTRGMDYAWVLGWYVLAKVFEFADGPIIEATGVISGHTLKHLAAAGAAAWLLRMLRRRDPKPVT